jgi:hypothetical protein
MSLRLPCFCCCSGTIIREAQRVVSCLTRKLDCIVVHSHCTYAYVPIEDGYADVALPHSDLTITRTGNSAVPYLSISIYAIHVFVPQTHSQHSTAQQDSRLVCLRQTQGEMGLFGQVIQVGDALVRRCESCG